MTQFDQLVKALKQFHSKKWINQYFDLQKRLFEDLSIDGSDQRLALSLTRDLKLPANIGQRYVLLPKRAQFVRCIVPAEFEEQAVNARLIGWFSPRSTRDAKWVEVPFTEGKPFPPVLYNACLEACTSILHRSKKSGFRKHHIDLLYNFTMEPSVRKEVLHEFE